MSNNRLYIAGQDFTQWASGLDELSESYSLKEDGSIEIGQTSQVVLSGEGYDYWYDIFFNDSCNSINNEYDVRIKIGDCNVNLDFIIKSQGVSIDPVNCKIKLNFNAKDEREQAVQWLQKTYFWDREYGFLDYALGRGRVPKMLWVNEFTTLSKIIAVIYFSIINPLLEFIEAIIDIINTIPRVDISKRFFEQLDDDVIGAGEYTTVVYIRDVIEFWGNKAGLTFKSSIIQGDYQDAALFAKLSGNGFDIQDCDKFHFDEDNAPNLNVVELFELLSPVFNAEWKIIGTDLYFERKDYFDGLRSPAFSLEYEVKAGRISDGWEYTFDNTENCARFIGEFATDSIDTQGNRALEFYRKNVDYNKDIAFKNRKGDCRPVIQFGGLRCTEDKYRDVRNSVYWFSRGTIQYTHSIVLSQTYAQQYKIFCIDQNFKLNYKGCEFRYVCMDQIDPPNSIDPEEPDYSGRFEYNTPFWFETLYDKFHYINDPDLNQNRFVEIRSLTWKPENFCDAVNFLRKNKLNIKIQSKYGDGIVKGGFTINYKTCSIDFQDIRFKCN